MNAMAMALLVTGLPGLSLELSAPETSVLVGEPLRITVRWNATADVPSVLVEDEDFLTQSLQFGVDSGSAPQWYREYRRSMADQVTEPAGMSRGEETVVNYVLVSGGYYAPGASRATPSLLFPAPGSYTLKAVYISHPTRDVLAESNAVTFTVSAPTGDEAAVFAALNADPQMREGLGDPARVRSLVNQYPQSRYLRRAKIALFERRANALLNREHPETGQSLWHLDDAALAAFRADQYRAMAEDVNADGNWGAFEEERLLLVASYASAGGASDMSRRARDEIVARFPRSQAAVAINAWEASMASAALQDKETDDTPPPSNDTTPPTLELSPSPSTLPASYVMVPVIVTVTVRDDRDPQPAVRLESITCAEMGRLCSSYPNVEGVEFGADDREFELQGAPPLGGRTRVFTIMYSATDASGNRATGSTTVSVTPPPPK